MRWKGPAIDLKALQDGLVGNHGGSPLGKRRGSVRRAGGKIRAQPLVRLPGDGAGDGGAEVERKAVRRAVLERGEDALAAGHGRGPAARRLRRSPIFPPRFRVTAAGR